MADITDARNQALVALAAEIVAAYLAHNSLPAADLPALLAAVHAKLAGLDPASPERVAEVEGNRTATPAQIRRSITPDALISFIDGKPYKTLKRHLAAHGLDPDSYRRRFGLLSDYPMVAPNYAAHRSALARSSGFGDLRRKTPAAVRPTPPERAHGPAMRLRRAC